MKSQEQSLLLRLCGGLLQLRRRPLLVRRESTTTQPIDLDDEQSVHVEPESKRQRVEDSMDADDGLYHDINYYALEADEAEGYVMSIDIDVSSNRQHKSFWRNPLAVPGKEDILVRSELPQVETR